MGRFHQTLHQRRLSQLVLTFTSVTQAAGTLWQSSAYLWTLGQTGLWSSSFRTLTAKLSASD